MTTATDDERAGGEGAPASASAGRDADSGHAADRTERLRAAVMEESPTAIALVGTRAAAALGFSPVPAPDREFSRGPDTEPGGAGSGERDGVPDESSGAAVTARAIDDAPPDGTGGTRSDEASGTTTGGGTGSTTGGPTSGLTGGSKGGLTGGATPSEAGAPDAAVTWRRFDSLADCLKAAPGERHADVALFAPDGLDGFERALGTACRLFPARLLLLVQAPDLPAPERLFAFGFRRVVAMRQAAEAGRPATDPDGSSAAPVDAVPANRRAIGQEDGEAGAAATGEGSNPGAGAEASPPDAVLYEYRLRDYKQPPDWLNARFWANPARFDLDEEWSDYEDGADEFEDDEDESDSEGGSGGEDRSDVEGKPGDKG